jgi:hypothetical protein
MTTYPTFLALVTDLKKTRRLRDVRIDYPLVLDILAKGQCLNRKTNTGKIAHMAKALTNGHWNRDCLGTFDVLIEKGGVPRFADGQHRLLAIKQAVEVLNTPDAHLVVDISVVESLLGQDEGTPRSVRDHLEIQGFDGVLIAPALTALYRSILGTSGTNTEYLGFSTNRNSVTFWSPARSACASGSTRPRRTG